MLNDFLQAGRDYTRDFVKGLSRIKLRNPIALRVLQATARGVLRVPQRASGRLLRWNSVESHDDAVRAAFGKKHYTMEQVETSIDAALRHGCKRFDLYFMTGYPADGDSVRDTFALLR